MDRYSIALGKKPPLKPVAAHFVEGEKRGFQLDDKTKNDLISSYLNTATGRSSLAASMSAPLSRRLDLNSLARRLLLVDPLPAGAIPVYDKNPLQDSYVINDPNSFGELGFTVSAITSTATRLSIPTFEIGIDQSVTLRALRDHSNVSNSIENAQDSALSGIRSIEDRAVLALLQSASNTNTVTAVSPEGLRAPNVLIDAFAMVERHDLRVAFISMGLNTYNTIRRYGRDYIDPNTDPALLSRGLMGFIFGAQLVVNRSIPDDTIFVTAEPTFVGVMPIRSDITVISADDPRSRLVGWRFFEHVGFCCLNPVAVSRISIV